MSVAAITAPALLLDKGRDMHRKLQRNEQTNRPFFPPPPPLLFFDLIYVHRLIDLSRFFLFLFISLMRIICFLEVTPSSILAYPTYTYLAHTFSTYFMTFFCPFPPSCIPSSPLPPSSSYRGLVFHHFHSSLLTPHLPTRLNSTSHRGANILPLSNSYNSGMYILYTILYYTYIHTVQITTPPSCINSSTIIYYHPRKADI